MAFVTFPALQDAITQLREANNRLSSLDERNKLGWHLNSAVEQLEDKVLAGWVQRLGLDGLPRSERLHPDDPEYQEPDKDYHPI